MARGFASIVKAGKKIDSYGKSNALYLKLPNDGDEAVVRFLEEGDEVYSFWFHDFSHVDAGEGCKTKVPCLDQEEDGTPCPGCREGLPRKFQGLINVIWRDGPVFAKNDDGSIDWDNQTGTGDVVAVWRQGITVFNKVLRRKDEKFGLTTRDFDIVRQGTNWNDTSYSVDPNDPDAGKKPLSAADKKLAENKYDLEKLARFVDEETFEKIIDKKLGESSNGDSEGEDDLDDVASFLKEEPFEKE
jgi:hypothetical protein